MTKGFYVVVPASPAGALYQREAINQDILSRVKTQLDERLNFVASGLSRVGIQSTRLNNAALKELLWSIFNPKEAETGQVPQFPD